MYKIACATLGTPTCSFVATGETKEEAMAKMKAHARTVHTDSLEGVSEEEFSEKMEDAVTEE